MEDDKALISKTTATNDLKASILKSVSLIGGFTKTIEKGDAVWLKPNFNTGDVPPGSSDTDFVKAVIDLLVENGSAKVIVGESSIMSAS